MNAPFAPIERLFAPLLRSTRPGPASPLTVPPTVKVLVVQLIATLPTLAPPTLPVPPVTKQVWLGALGWVSTVTA